MSIRWAPSRASAPGGWGERGAREGEERGSAGGRGAREGGTGVGDVRRAVCYTEAPRHGTARHATVRGGHRAVPAPAAHAAKGGEANDGAGDGRPRRGGVPGSSRRPPAEA